MTLPGAGQLHRARGSGRGQAQGMGDTAGTVLIPRHGAQPFSLTFLLLCLWTSPPPAAPSQCSWGEPVAQSALPYIPMCP